MSGADILIRHGRVAEAAAIWDEVARATPDDVWVYNDAGLEYASIGEHEQALPWLTQAIEVAKRSGDPERLLSQLRGLRATTLTALGLELDELQTAEPEARRPAPSSFHDTPERTGPQYPIAWAWLPAEEYAHLDERWPDFVDATAVLDADGGRVPHPEYCRRLERLLREARDAGISKTRVAPLRSTDFARWVAETQPDDGEPAQLRARYAATLCRQPAEVLVWPPERNAACWCGSGSKYKKCCGGPGVDGHR